MPLTPVTVRTLFETYQKRLGLRWLAGRNGADRDLSITPQDAANLSWVGHLNFIHPHRIQVLGGSELEYLHGLGKNSYEDALARLFAPETAAIVVAGGKQVPLEMVNRGDLCATPVIGSDLSSDKLVEHLDYYLSGLLADRVVLHGVFMDVMGIGVLLTGKSSVGKSELALELITRGHRLVADDAPEFTRVAPDTLRGTCPELLRDFLEVRGLGVLNVRAMFGDSAIKESKNLRLVVSLVSVEELNKIDRLEGNRQATSVLEVETPLIQIPVAPGRNLAVLVEAAVRNHILYFNGYDAAWDFIERQRRLMEEQEPR